METEHGAGFESLVTAWRRRLLAAGLWPAEVDELEGHLRDAVEDGIRRGLSAERALEAASASIGAPDELLREMQESRRPRDFRGRSLGLLDALTGGLAGNYSRVVWRTLRRDRGFAAISILGLGVGIGLCLLLLAFVRFELRYDAMHEKGDRIVRVAKGSRATTPGLWGPEIQATFPEVEAAVRVMDGQFSRARFVMGEVSVPTGEGLVADHGFLQVFSWQLARGNPETALAEPGTVLLTPALSRALFGELDPMGRRLSVEGAGDFPARVELVVTGLLEESNAPSHLTFGFVVSMATVDALDRAGDWGTPFSWTNAFVKTYLLLNTGTETASVAARFPSFIEARVSSDRYARDDVFLQPLRSIHLRSRLRFDPPQSGGIRLVGLLGLVSALVLAIACANFINLAVARSMHRAREIGMRKAVGADRGQLILQFLAESIAISAVATLLAVPLVVAARPTFESLIARPLPLSAVIGWWSVPALVALALVVGVAAGWYPALQLSRFRPIQALRARTIRLGRGLSAQALVVSQFAISIGLIAVAVTLSAQMQFVAGRDLGFPHQDLLVVPIGQSETVSRNADAFLDRLVARSGVASASATHSIPSSFLNEFSYLLDGASLDDRISLGSLSVGTGFFETFRPPFLAGRGLDPSNPADSMGFVINQAALTRLGITDPAEALGRRLEWLLGDLGFAGEIIGVIDNFHYGSLREDIPPIVIHVTRFGVSYAVVRAQPGRMEDAVQTTRAVWSEMEPGHPFQFETMTERVSGQYAVDQRLTALFALTAGIAVLLACLGLYGLMAFLAARRRLELGVRKVLGASAGSLLALFLRDTARWVLLGLFLAAPVAWLAANRWLEGFAYHIEPGPVPFLVAGGVALLVAAISVSAQTLGVVLRKPTVSLRSE